MSGLSVPDVQELPRAAWPWIGGVTILFGALFVLFGYRLFKLLIAVVGFLVGGAAAALFVQTTLAPHPALTLAAGLVIGVICATLVFLVYLVGVFALGAGVGAAGAAGVLNALHVPPEPLYILVPAGVLGLLAVLVQRLVLVFCTSCTGALLVLTGALLLRSGPAAWQYFQRPQSLARADLLWLGGAVLLAVFGIFLQYTFTGHKPPAEPDDAANPDDEMPVRVVDPDQPRTDAMTSTVRYPTASHEEFARNYAPGMTSFHGSDPLDGSGVEPDEADIDAAVAESIAAEQGEDSTVDTDPADPEKA